ncbi:WD repeat containing protein 33 [Paragonimus heterotremus]|uniref:WD repeat containing protein 33 n=1 Tax=Paragonimus heterotremus TaxID=100268 RepID=A0A8J4SUL8_9TREM|nr:WD repeat containing protein 33 [Paragonimus heterotremus]
MVVGVLAGVENSMELAQEEISSSQTLPTSTTDAKKSRKAVFRRTIDYNASVMNYLKDRLWIYQSTDRPSLQPDYLWSPKLYPPKFYLDSPMNCVMSKPVRTSTNKNKCPIYCWTPEGRRLITGAFSGEFTLWNGLTFNFETILQAHESQIRCMKWSHNEEWLLTADHSGYVKYWQANMNNVEMYQAHKEPIRGVSFCPFDCKFVTCSDDSTVRIWDFHRCSEERVLRGHGSDVRSVAWHPTLSLIISGSKDAQQPIKLWDPKTGESVSTLYIHKNTCTDVAWNDNGNWFLTASRDHLIKLFDLRNLKAELQTFRGHKRDVMRVAWHPFHEGLFASGSADGSIFYWLAGTDTELGAVENAHESMIWSLAWHPFGHILVSGANDFATKFWTRNRPGDVSKDNAAVTTAEGLIQAAGVLGHTIGDTETPESLNLGNDLLRAVAERSFPNSGLDLNEEIAFVSNPEDIGNVEIPGLNEGIVMDLNVTETGDENDDRGGNKLRSNRTIPKEFAANWASTRITAMPTVMMMPPAPSPTQLVSAVAAAAAAVSDFTSTPQYLPPVKPPPTTTANKDRGGARPTTPTMDSIRAMPSPSEEHPHGVCTRPVRPMNYLGQPPEPEPVILPPREPERINPMNVRMERRDSGGSWKDTYDAAPPLDMNNTGGHPPPPRINIHHEDREPFHQPPLPPPPVRRGEYQRRVEDRDYRDYEHPEPVARPSGPPPPPHYFNRPPFGRKNYDGRPSEMHPHGMHPNRVPLEHNRNFGPEMEKPVYDQGADRYPLQERHHPFHGHRDGEHWERGWPEEGANRFGSFPPRPPRGPAPIRGPPHPPEHFHPDPGANFYPPNKRPLPPPPPGRHPPEHRHKYPRPEGHWGSPKQW